MLEDLILTRNRALIEAVELTDSEKAEALLEGKRKKFFLQRGAEYWEEEYRKAEIQHELKNAMERQKRLEKKTM